MLQAGRTSWQNDHVVGIDPGQQEAVADVDCHGVVDLVRENRKVPGLGNLSGTRTG